MMCGNGGRNDGDRDDGSGRDDGRRGDGGRDCCMRNDGGRDDGGRHGSGRNDGSRDSGSGCDDGRRGDGGRALSRRTFLRALGPFGATGAALLGIAAGGRGRLAVTEIASASEGAIVAGSAGSQGDSCSLIATFLDVGKADAIVLQTPTGCAMVDTGTAATADDVLSSLAELGVDAIDALIITHFDQDHVGGAAAVLRGVPVGEVYVTYESKESDEVDAYHAALAQVGMIPYELVVGSTLDLTIGGMDLHIIAPNSYDYGENDTSNDSSLVVRLICDGVTMLLAGDIERGRIDELLAGDEDLTCDLIKMPHHGGYEKNTEDLIEACSPAYAVITSSKSEKEDDDTKDDLKDAGVKCFLTRKGTVTARVDGGVLRVEQ